MNPKELIQKLKAKARSTTGQERRTFEAKAEHMEYHLLNKWSWWRLLAIAIKAKEGM